MKVTIFTSDIHHGGVAQVTKSYIDIFQKIDEIKKIDIIILRGNEKNIERSGKINEIVLINKNVSPHFFIKIFQVIKAGLRFVSYLLKNKTDVVVSLNLEPNFIVNFSKFIYPLEFKNITTEHTNLINYYSRPTVFKEIFKNIIKIIYPYSNVILGCSDGVKQSIESVYSVTNTTFIYNSIRSDLVYEKSEKKDFYLSLGRLDSLKGYRELISSIGDHLIQKNRKLKIAGDGPDSTKLRQLVDDLKLGDHVEFLGHVRNPSKLYSEARAYICTSYLEGFPLNLIEAQSYKLPIIASDCLSGPREILLGKSDYENRLKTGHIERNGCFLIPTPDSKTFSKDLNDALNFLDLEDNQECEVNIFFTEDCIRGQWRNLLVVLSES